MSEIEIKQIRLDHFCAQYDMPKTNIYELMHTKGFPAYKIGKRWYVDIPEFLKWREKEHRRNNKYA